MMNGMQRLETPEFIATELETLGQGDEAFQGTLFPGVYPGDRESFASMLATGAPIIDYTYRNLVHRTGQKEAAIRRLRVLPAAGQFGYTDKDVAAIEGATAIIASAGEDARIVTYDEALKGKLIEACGPDNPFVKRYIQGVEARDPKASFWSVRRAVEGLGTTVLKYVGILDYDNGTFLGHEPYDAPHIPKDVLQYEAFWRSVYNQATKPRLPT